MKMLPVSFKSLIILKQFLKSSNKFSIHTTSHKLCHLNNSLTVAISIGLFFDSILIHKIFPIKGNLSTLTASFFVGIFTRCSYGSHQMKKGIQTETQPPLKTTDISLYFNPRPITFVKNQMRIKGALFNEHHPFMIN